MNKLTLFFFSLLVISLLVACASGSQETASEKANDDAEQVEDKGTLTFGATAGPYSDMVAKAIQPLLEEHGYTIKIVEFSDYVQPNIALGNGSINANLFQHKIYMENFAESNGLELSDVIAVPTAPMGIYSNKYASMDEIEDGTEIAVPNDPTNMARALMMLEEAGFITISEDANPLTVSERDVAENRLNLKITPIEAAQLPRAVDSVALAAVPGNFALAAEMDLLDALQLENMLDDYRNRVVVNTSDLEKPFVADIKAAVESVEFEKMIDEQFKGFGKPEWMLK